MGSVVQPIQVCWPGVRFSPSNVCQHTYMVVWSSFVESCELGAKTILAKGAVELISPPRPLIYEKKTNVYEKIIQFIQPPTHLQSFSGFPVELFCSWALDWALVPLFFVILLSSSVFGASAISDGTTLSSYLLEQTTEERNKVKPSCSGCHSVSYIARFPAFSSSLVLFLLPCLKRVILVL